ncbi:LytR/AlgR family response regulator transcription factor [Pedobacter jeongneungensis]|uniref:LytR/AlgR family response regulator transcription factor n=1 Tax=Pedobacter jeongneungensis TaxID=947309 RepID=UPI0004685BF6|nr:LytTR family DNA-binding domain-containing protein [Pedobacter jeongneungensis]
MKKTYNCAIVDDDWSAIRLLTDHIGEFPNLNVTKTFTKPIEALAELSIDQNIDLIFLDIDMPGLSGIQVAENLRDISPNIIFTTAHDRYALQAFDVRAKDFLLKPIELETFTKVVNRVLKECFVKKLSRFSYDDLAFFRPGRRGVVDRIDLSAITHFKGAGNYVDIFTKDERFTIYMTIQEISDILTADDKFFRVHKSYLINGSYVTRIVGNIVYLGKHPIPMTSPYKARFCDFVGEKIWVSKRV